MIEYDLRVPNNSVTFAPTKDKQLIINLINNKTMKTIFLVEWTSKESLNAGRPAWRVHEAYITQEAAQARAKELNAEDTKDIHRVTSTVLNEK